MTVATAKKELERVIDNLAARHSRWEVFTDFVAMGALAASNSVDQYHFQSREGEYMQIIGKYSKDEQAIFPQMFAHLVEALESSIQDGGFEDILGGVFHDLELHNKYKGQFFSPMSLCNMMGEISIGDTWQETIVKRGYISISEPACGAGAMILGAANAYKSKGLDWSTQMFVSAVDVDIKCVQMAYLQLSLYGIPAVVVHGNTLTTEAWSYWYTPVYMLDQWFWREPGGITTQKRPDIEAFRQGSMPAYRAIVAIRDLLDDAPADKPYKPIKAEKAKNCDESRVYQADNKGQLLLF